MERVNIISLGCAKNLVDSEWLMRQLEYAGYAVSADPDMQRADVVIINTCGFIGDAKEESINTILEQLYLKRKGAVKQVFVMGCLSQRFGTELEKELPEVDRFFGKFDAKAVVEALERPYEEELRYERILTTPSHYAYLKIAEGCSRTCSYCAIPLITGPYVSRPMDEVVEEAQYLVKKGVKELLVIAQDTTCYGIDFDGKSHLAELLERLSDIEGLEWIRLHYAYPNNFPMEVLRLMRERKNICKYLDIPLQHISDHMLHDMRRGITKAETLALLETIRREVPGVAIRTTLMVGHPGETEEDFEELLEFVREQRFERVGSFTYSHEEGTYCDLHYTDDVPLEVKEDRKMRLEMAQSEVIDAWNEKMQGQTLRVLIDSKEGESYLGRTEYDSPEVDPEIWVETRRHLKPGHFYEVKVTGSDEADLVAEYLG